MDDASVASREGERRRVLDMLEQGKISAAEAEELLAALRPGSAADGPSPPATAPIIDRRRGSLSGLPAVAVVMARALARTIGRVSFVLGRVAGTVARLFGRAQAHSSLRDR